MTDKPNKYQVDSIFAKDININDRLQNWQDEGWEICGECLLVKSNDSSTVYWHIPLRRLITEADEPSTTSQQHNVNNNY